MMQQRACLVLVLWNAMWEHEKDILEKVVPSALAAAVSLNE